MTSQTRLARKRASLALDILLSLGIALALAPLFKQAHLRDLARTSRRSVRPSSYVKIA